MLGELESVSNLGDYVINDKDEDIRIIRCERLCFPTESACSTERSVCPSTSDEAECGNRGRTTEGDGSKRILIIVGMGRFACVDHLEFIGCELETSLTCTVILV